MVEVLARRRGPADEVVDLLRREALGHRGRRHDAPLARGRRVVALEGHADNVVTGADREEDLGGRRDQRDDAHATNVGQAAAARTATPAETGRCGTIHDVPGCVFCQIVAGDLAAEVVLDTDDFVGFLDARPVFKGHVLLVPREHVDTLPDLPAGLRDGFLEAAQRLATAVKDGLGAQGSFVAMNNTVSQSVPHLHLHVVPRTKGDGLRGFFWPRTKYADGEAAAYAARLRDALG